MANVMELFGQLQSLLKERKVNIETPLQVYLDYIKVERDVLERLVRIPLESTEE
jgi:hypothetical protein